MDEIVKDKRFAHVVRDPRFHRMARNQRKVKIDKRFKDMFTDKRFKLKYSVDKRGRPIKLTTNENLKKYYELDGDSSDDEDASEDENDDAEAVRKTSVKDESENDEVSGEDESESDSEEGSDTDSEVSDEEEGKSKAALTTIKDPRFKIPKIKTLKGEKVKKKKQKEMQEKHEQVSKAADLANVKKQGKLIQETVKVKQKSKPNGKRVPTAADSSSESGDEEEDEDKEDSEEEEEESEEEGDEDDEEEGDEDEEEETGVPGSGLDLARGDGNMDSSSSEEEDDEIEDVIGTGTSSGFDHRWGELDEEADTVTEATSRLAVCTMDWDRIKAKDIFMLLNSFKPTKGVIMSVKVYKSEYGKARIEEEKVQGPRELKELKDERGDSDEETEDNIGTKYHTEKLREYQLNRLKYFYAVVECDTMATADEIYKECDGLEYETSSTKLDLRFIPEDMEFEDEPESVCTSVPPDYKPSLFINTALSQSKVELTWDETDRERVQRTAQQFSSKAQDLKEDDLQAYLASSSDEEGPDYGALVDQSDDDDDREGGEAAKSEDKQINKYKMLLQEIDQGEKEKQKNDVQMEITWEPGLRETTEGLLKKKEQKGQTPWEEYLEKKKEKKRQKREERKKKKVEDRLDSDQEDGDQDDAGDATVDMDEGGQAFSDDEMPTGVDFDDPFFSELQTKKKSDKDKRKKKKKKEEKQASNEDVSSEKAALSLLVMEEDDKREHFNLKNLVQAEKKKKKKKKQHEDDEEEEEDGTKQVDNFHMNVKDPRFTAMYDSHLFNLDPSAPEYKKTKGTEAIIEEKQKRRRNSEKRKQSSDGKRSDGAKKHKFEADTEAKKAKDNSLASLVNSVKVKTKNFQSKKNKR